MRVLTRRTVRMLLRCLTQVVCSKAHTAVHERMAATAWEREIHRRLLRSEETASAELCAAYLEQVIQRLHGYRNVPDEVLLDNAAVDALLDYIERPETYDPDRLGLLGFLTMAAKRDLLNALEKWRRAASWTVPLEVVEEGAEGGSKLVETQGLEYHDQYQLGDEPDLIARVRQVIPDPQDQEILQLMIAGVRETEVYARVLEIEDLEKSEQAKRVKREKDRLKRRLKRLGFKLDGT